MLSRRLDDCQSELDSSWAIVFIFVCAGTAYDEDERPCLEVPWIPACAGMTRVGTLYDEDALQC